MNKSKGVRTYPAGRVVHGVPFSAIDAEKFFFLPFEQLGQYFGQGGRGVWTLLAAAGGVILPIIVPHGKSSVLEWLDPPYYRDCHYLDYWQYALGKRLDLA